MANTQATSRVRPCSPRQQMQTTSPRNPRESRTASCPCKAMEEPIPGFASGSLGALFLFAPDAVPEHWRSRAVPMALVPLLPSEARSILEGPQATIAPEDEDLLRLAARGLTGADIARELGISLRSVERRLARLRRDLGVDSTAELAAFLSKRGF